MKKILRELLWLGIALGIGVGSGFLLLYMMQEQPGDEALNSQEQVFAIELYLIGCGLGIGGVYLARLMAWVIRR